jgi:hypothetical protein
MLVCLRLSELVILMYLSKGSKGSISLIFLNLSDFVHHFFTIALMFIPIDCLIAEILIGSWHCKNIGRLFPGLDPCSMASLAKASALSLPTVCHAPCMCHDISAPIDLIPTHPFVRHYHDVGSYPCDSPYDPKPPDIIPISLESDWIFETQPAAALRYICSRRLGFDFGIMFHTSYLWYLILESWLHVSFCFHFTI